MSVVKIHGKPYKFTHYENELIEKNRLTPGIVAQRVRNGWTGNDNLIMYTFDCLNMYNF
ncbi:TPA: hypothetical protein PSA57_001727, partial [Staphylococcus aureus]|uniref:SA1788 family PVL leukocidin-associated protein n=1 Tax=Staphylococcus aureus TaxID=1280 RepID=UPI000B0D941A|nr:SA1788 family PVL leukocidin-associated protein [Staphylococcus aureus]BDV05248.1 hypothetical protein JP008_12070 [Staphylococcus aureus]HDK4015066.1 hypothetical protein [Staphylococcus aureus]